MTHDQLKQNEFQDTKKIILTEFKIGSSEKNEFSGTYHRKFRRLIVYPRSMTPSNGNSSYSSLPKQIVFKIRRVTGQGFELKKMYDETDWVEYHLRSRMTFGIE